MKEDLAAEKDRNMECSTCSIFYEPGKSSVDFRHRTLHFFLSIPSTEYVNKNIISECPKHFPAWLVKMLELYKSRGIIVEHKKRLANIYISVDWKKYSAFKKSFKDDSRSKMHIDVLLSALGILSLSSWRNWGIVSLGDARRGGEKKPGDSLNPGDGLFYFCHLDNARDYTKLKWPRSRGYKWEIRKVEEIYTADMCYSRK